MNVSEWESKYHEEHRTKRRSFVWNFFEKVSRHRVQCRLCNHEQNYQGTTGNILRHLKARHCLDATIKGQQDPENQVRIRELMLMTSSVSPLNNIDQINIRKRSLATDSSDTVDTYSEKGNEEMKFENGNMFCEELQEDCIYNERKEGKKSAKRTQLEEDRIVAETEYFREKASYFRIQKHLTALQAKKVKLEIEQFVLNNKNAVEN